MRRGICLTAVLLAASSALLPAQGRRDDRDRSRASTQDDCGQRWDSRRHRHCEVRESSLPGLNPIDIDAGQNGGIRIRGWDRAEVHVLARIQTHADSEAAARSLASGIRIDTSGNNVRAEGPARSGDDEGWSVSFEIDVPRAAMIAMRAVNGGIKLGEVAGDIRGTTMNGGITVDLNGDHWDGAGLDVETRNGGVQLGVPANYSATLEAGTVNGRINIDFPITVQGTLSRRLTTTLGSGGAKLRVVTTNGGVSIRRRS